MWMTLLLSASWSVATLSFRWETPRLYLAALLLLLGSSAWLLGAHAERTAMAPPLRQLLDHEFGG